MEKYDFEEEESEAICRYHVKEIIKYWMQILEHDFSGWEDELEMIHHHEQRLFELLKTEEEKENESTTNSTIVND